MLEELASGGRGAYRIRLARLTAGGLMTHWLMVEIAPFAGGSRIALDFMTTQRITLLPEDAEDRHDPGP
jgi:hypothetical protein